MAVVTLVVIAVVAALLLGGAANAAPSPGTLGTLTIVPAMGTNFTVGSVHTSSGCTAGGDAVYTDIVGPIGAATPTFPQPYNLTMAETFDFSSIQPMDIPWDTDLADAAGPAGLMPGQYDLTTHCVDSVTLQDFGTFTGSLTFIDPTHYTTNLAATPAPTPTSGPTPIPSPPLSGTLGILTIIPAMGTNFTVGSVHTSSGCTAGGDAVYTDIVGPIGAATPTFPLPYNLTTTETVSFSSTQPMDIPWNTDLADAAGPSGRAGLMPGQYDLTTHCVDSFTLQDFGTFTGSLTFTDPTHYTTSPSAPPTQSPTPVPTTPPTTTPNPTPSVGIIRTTITLQVAPNPGHTFIPEILIARVSPPNAVGRIQFFDRNTLLSTPVPAAGGFAFFFATLPKGTHSLTATFSPNNTEKCSAPGGFKSISTPPPCPTFSPSTSSPVSLTVNSLF